MKIKYLDNEIQLLNSIKRNNEISDYGQEKLNEFLAIKKRLTVVDRLPESDYIRQQAQQMDEKEFDEWWWETVYKGN